MTRPAIVIGLGGTGQWVLTFLKKELLEIGKGVMPPGVKLLAFDTTTYGEADQGIQKSDPSKSEEEEIKLGAVQLKPQTEFISIGDNVLNLCHQIAAGQHNYLQWFPASSFLAKLPQASFDTRLGSGQLRQFGRISVFNDVQSAANSTILNNLRAAIKDLHARVSDDEKLEIMIVGSLAGGTGAGMLIDIPLLVRAQAKALVAENYTVRGFFVLPNAFGGKGIGEDLTMNARAYAAWRELDRFMLISDRFGAHQINYHSTNQDLQMKITSRPYDVSYMIDGDRSHNSLSNEDTRKGIFPSVAHIISAILDEKAGLKYTAYVSTNLAGKLGTLPRKPYHSAVGSYTLKVPVYFSEAKFSHQMAQEILDTVLAPERNENDRVTHLSETRNIIGQQKKAKDYTLSFMAGSGLDIGQTTIPNTLFMPVMSEVRNRDALKDGKFIDQVSRGGLSQINNRFLQALTDISQDEAGKLIQNNITAEISTPIWGYAPPSRERDGVTPEQNYQFLQKKVSEVRFEHYGVDEASSERNFGKFGKALREAQKAQIERMKKMTTAWVQSILNGKETDDPISAKGGRIGYARACLEQLIQTCSYFEDFLDAVSKERNETHKLGQRSKQAESNALRNYEILRGKKCFLTFWDGFTHPHAHQAERNYLRAVEQSIGVRKDDILIYILKETSAEFKGFVRASLEHLDNWVAHLATGDPDRNLESLYEAVKNTLESVKVNHKLDKNLERVAEIIGEADYDSEEENISEAISRLSWEVKNLGDRLEIGFGIYYPAVDDAPAYNKHFRVDGDRPTDWNLDLILELGKQPYQTLHKDTTLAQEVMEIYPTGGQLAASVDKKGEPLYRPSAPPVGPRETACYVRVHSNVNDQTTQYFQDFERELKNLNKNVMSFQMVDSQDKHKLTIVRSDDLLPSSDFEVWHNCRRAYISKVTHPTEPIKEGELHIFPAERNASYYESLIPKYLEENFRTLHPEVVSLLESRIKFELFFRCYALGFIKKVRDENNQPYWVFQIDDGDPLWLSKPIDSFQEGAFREKEMDLFEVIFQFVNVAQDIRPGRGQARFVDWQKTNQAVISKEKDLGHTKVTSLYKAEIEKGIVSLIEEEIRKKRENVTEDLRSLYGQEFEDLAKVAKVIFMKAIGDQKK